MKKQSKTIRHYRATLEFIHPLVLLPTFYHDLWTDPDHDDRWSWSWSIKFLFLHLYLSAWSKGSEKFPF